MGAGRTRLHSVFSRNTGRMLGRPSGLVAQASREVGKDDVTIAQAGAHK